LDIPHAAKKFCPINGSKTRIEVLLHLLAGVICHEGFSHGNFSHAKIFPEKLFPTLSVYRTGLGTQCGSTASIENALNFARKFTFKKAFEERTNEKSSVIAVAEMVVLQT
jgi:hypothetical protein